MSQIYLSNYTIKEPDLWATLEDGKPIGLHEVSLTWEARNQPAYLLGQRAAAFVNTCYPETYRLAFSKSAHDVDIPRLANHEARLDVNGVRFTVESIVHERDSIRYGCYGWPIQVALTIPREQTPYFPGWEDVGHEYLDEDRYQW